MPFGAGDLLPEYRVRTSLEPDDFNNKIQDDDYARHHGFRAGVVSGMSLYAYMSRPLTEQLGREWLERGSAEVRFIQPVYEGEEIRIEGAITSIAADGTLLIHYQSANSQGVLCSTGTAILPPAAPSAEPTLEDYPASRAKLHRPISLDSLHAGDSLVPVSADFTWNIHWQYCRKAIRDLHPLYEKTLHPGWILSRAGQILAANYSIQGWIDVSCRVQHFHVQEMECTVQTRGRIQGKFEHKGDHFIELDLAVFAPEHCLATIHYTAVFRIAPNAA